MVSWHPLLAQPSMSVDFAGYSFCHLMLAVWNFFLDLYFQFLNLCLKHARFSFIGIAG